MLCLMRKVLGLMLASLMGTCVEQQTHYDHTAPPILRMVLASTPTSATCTLALHEIRWLAALVSTSALNVGAWLPKTAPGIPNVGLDLRWFQDHPR